MLASSVVTSASTWLHERPMDDCESLVFSQQMWCDKEVMVARNTSQEELACAADSYNKDKAGMLLFAGCGQTKRD